MRLPRGTIVRSRVVQSPATALAAALDDAVTGYLVLEPQDALLLGDDGSGVITLASGVPVLAYHVGTDRGGAEALADLAAPGPYSVELYAVDDGALDAAHEATSLRVPPGLPADRLAADPDLATRTREAAPADRREERVEEDEDPLAAFLADEERIAAIQEEAEKEAARRAEEWGLADALE
ncbi:hypothetical protein [Haloarchaeobius sp. HME9146]|uniref:hypothetical protein n=1 Tax=Haloarchaeobius sp. HME9146 TaxID=2978732 RepID=UPI0021BE1443|nr:hypothetical protein [Haloarchaeobius sp. HME9146]